MRSIFDDSQGVFLAKDMTKGSIARTLIAFSLPLIFSGILQQLYSWADAFIVGHAEGELQLAAVGATYSISFFFTNIILGLTLGLSIMAAQHSHTFTYRGWEVQSEGNPLSHAILRGYVDDKGRNHPNYHYEDLVHLAELYGEKKLQNPAVIIDTNHANSAKQYQEQARIAKDVIHSFRHSKNIHSLVKGLMVESYLEDGRQEIGANSVYGRSITDACLGWEKTERLVLDIAELV